MNIKRFILLVILALTFNNVFGQYFNYNAFYENIDKYIVVDSAYLQCSYKLAYLKDSSDLNKKSDDFQILLIGRNISKYYSQYALNWNLFVKEHIKTHDNYPNNSEEGAWSYEVFKNHPNGRITVTDIGSLLQKNFIYEEDFFKFQWKILSTETQNVLSYACQKATVTFRGRDYIAWFTPEIPISNGPWKFGGLPGLILKLYDTKENFVFECNGLEYLKTKKPIKYYQINYIKTKREELSKIYKRAHDNYIPYLEMMLLENFPGSKIKAGESSEENPSLKLPYNPIELE